jgi:uncharacterized membrane protein
MTLQDFNSLAVWILGGVFVFLCIVSIYLAYLDHKEEAELQEDDSKWDY